MKSKVLCINPKCGHAKIYFSGCYVRKSDSRVIKKYKCSHCLKYFSQATRHPCYKQIKRHKNFDVFSLLCSGMSQRRIAKKLNLNLKTVARKFKFLAGQCAFKNNFDLKQYQMKPFEHCFLDEMEDKIHTKCKPVSIALVVSKDRKILGHKVSSIMPKNRKLNKICRVKYPKWKDESRKGFYHLLEKIKPVFAPHIVIKSDKKQMYFNAIKNKFPKAKHIQYLSRRAVIPGLGELKEGGWDPLFPLNHTCAMLRSNINRLFRRTWCTSKKLESLSAHIEIYTYYHNHYLI